MATFLLSILKYLFVFCFIFFWIFNSTPKPSRSKPGWSKPGKLFHENLKIDKVNIPHGWTVTGSMRGVSLFPCKHCRVQISIVVSSQLVYQPFFTISIASVETTEIWLVNDQLDLVDNQPPLNTIYQRFSTHDQWSQQTNHWNIIGANLSSASVSQMVRVLMLRISLGRRPAVGCAEKMSDGAHHEETRTLHSGNVR